jgi:hypothetical protein
MCENLTRVGGQQQHTYICSILPSMSGNPVGQSGGVGTFSDVQLIGLDALAGGIRSSLSHGNIRPHAAPQSGTLVSAVAGKNELDEVDGRDQDNEEQRILIHSDASRTLPSVSAFPTQPSLPPPISPMFKLMCVVLLIVQAAALGLVEQHAIIFHI